MVILKRTTSILLLIHTSLLLFNHANGQNACTDSCDIDYRDLEGPVVHFCGTDNQTHNMIFDPYFKIMNCYRYNCNVSSFTPGFVCGCPNYCYEQLGKGACNNGTQTCQCNHGWGGSDCSHIKCPNDAGCNQGVCHSKDKDHPHDYCQCNEGWTGPECNAPTNDLPVLPYGDHFADRPYWYNDTFRDFHPIFNLSVIATIKIYVSEADLRTLLDPLNAWKNINAPAEFYFDNGNVQYKQKKAKLELKGDFSRTLLKKSFKVQHIDGTSFFGVDALSLKDPYPDASFLVNQLNAEYYRALNIPVARSSFGSVWVNDVFFGLYWISEEVQSPSFLKAHYPISTGNFYKCGGEAWLLYKGSDPQIYKNEGYIFLNGFHHSYSQIQGDGTFDDLANLIYIINNASNFETAINQTLDTARYLRQLIVETYTFNGDSYGSNGNNYLLYNNTQSGLIEFLPYDWDVSDTSINGSVFSGFGDPRAILFTKFISSNIIDLEEAYMDVFTSAIGYIFYNSAPWEQRVQVLSAFLQSEVERDHFYTLDWGRNLTVYLESNQELSAWDSQRVQNVMDQFDP